MIYSNLIDNASKYGRNSARRTASLVEAGVGPLSYVLNTATRLSDIAHGTVNKMLEQQHSAAVGTLEAGAKRLKTAADSQGVRDLVQDQVALLPETRQRMTHDLKKTWEILVDTRDELRGAFSVNAKSTIKKATKTAKKRTRKTAAKSKRTVKKAAGK